MRLFKFFKKFKNNIAIIHNEHSNLSYKQIIEKTNEIKIGFRFVFQSNKITIKEEQVNKIIEDIINVTLNLESVEIPGLR